MSFLLRHFADELLTAGMIKNGLVMRKPPPASSGSKEGDDEAAHHKAVRTMSVMSLGRVKTLGRRRSGLAEVSDGSRLRL